MNYRICNLEVKQCLAADVFPAGCWRLSPMGRRGLVFGDGDSKGDSLAREMREWLQVPLWFFGKPPFGSQAWVKPLDSFPKPSLWFLPPWLRWFSVEAKDSAALELRELAKSSNFLIGGARRNSFGGRGGGGGGLVWTASVFSVLPLAYH